MVCQPISIHAAREGGDELRLKWLEKYGEFQSTPPVKAATGRMNLTDKVTMISIHAAREGGDRMGATDFSDTTISIHAAREGGDDWVKILKKIIKKFQSTPPVKAATGLTATVSLKAGISIHAAREGGDGRAATLEIDDVKLGA